MKQVIRKWKYKNYKSIDLETEITLLIGAGNHIDQVVITRYQTYGLIIAPDEALIIISIN